MSYTYLQEQGEESSAGSYADIPQFVLSRLNLTAEKSYSSDNETASCQSSQYGMMCKHLTEHPGEEKLTLFAEDFPAKTLAVQEKERESKDQDQVCGSTWRELLVKFDPVTHSWKTHQCLWEEDLPWSLVTLPKWGMMLDGVCWEQLMPVRHTDETEYGLWPTPRAGNPGSRPNGKGGKVLAEEVAIAEGIRKRGQRMWPTPRCFMHKDAGYDRGKANLGEVIAGVEGGTQENPIGGHLNPTWVEWLMGWPLEWTGLKQSGMGKFQRWLHSHGKF